MASVDDYPIGTVAVATVRGVPNVRVMLIKSGGKPTWIHTQTKTAVATCRDITDIRPLVVLDWTPSQTDLPTLLTVLRDNYWTSLADQIEAQTKPPRIPEPGLWGVVHGSLMRGKDPWTLVRHEEGWVATDGGVHQWRDLLDPVLIREGVRS